jgi:hypothetical protein
MRQARFPVHKEECVLVPAPIKICDQQDEEISNNFNLDALSVKRQTLLVDEDDGLLGKGMRLAG